MNSKEHQCWEPDWLDTTEIYYEEAQQSWILHNPSYYGSEYRIVYCPFCGTKLSDESQINGTK